MQVCSYIVKNLFLCVFLLLNYHVGVSPMMFLIPLFFESKYSKGGPCCEILLKKAKQTLQMGSGSTPPIGIWLF
jgi:hypothetical protein